MPIKKRISISDINRISKARNKQKVRNSDMKQKQALVWSMIMALLLSFVPFGAFQTAQAATPTFFIPDNVSIASTANIPLETLSRSNTYNTTSKTFGIDGTFNVVDKDTLTVTVEALVKDPTVTTPTPANPGFTADAGRTYSKGVTATSVNRFSVGNLDVYPGFNRVTFKGTQAGVQKSDTFYVLYDQVPYLQSLTVTSSGATPPASLNQGASIVVTTDQVLLQGVAPNATNVSVKGVQAAVQDDGTFFVPSMKLTPGYNQIDLTISNSANTINITRTLYYYDSTRPFIDLDVVTPTDGTVSLKDTAYNKAVPPLITDTAGTANLNVNMLIPYNPSAFTVTGASYTAAVTLNGTDVSSSVSVSSQSAIPGPDGYTPSYRLVSFTVNSFPFKQDPANMPNYLTNQTVALSVYYNGNTTSVSPTFSYYPGDTIIKNVSLVDTNGAALGANLNYNDPVAVKPLNGSDVTSPNFYILVQAAKNIATPGNLNAQLLPIGTAVTLAPKATYTDSSGVNPKYYVYQVQNLPTGNQQISFKFTGSSASYVASVNYVSKDYITVDSLMDGQTITIDSKTVNATTPLPVNVAGNVSGSDPLLSFNFAANGKSSTPSLSGNAFNFNINIGGASPDLVVGQNTLIFTATFNTGTGTMAVTKQLKLYVVDTNVPAMKIFQPAAIPASGTRIDIPSYPTVDPTLQQILADPTNVFSFQSSKYVTSAPSYDLVIRFSGAARLVLKRGSDVIADYTDISIPTGAAAAPTSGITATNYNYRYSGNSNDFIVRFTDLKFATPGSHVYTLELTNATGSKITQRLEIERQVSPLRIVAPVPNSGSNIVVTKNFVRIDVEAEGATDVLVDGNKATKRTDDPTGNRWIYDYVGLKADKANTIKIQAKRSTVTNATITVYYTSDVNINSEYMEKLSTKHTIFGGDLQLAFPKGTVLRNVVDPNDTTQTTKYFPDNKLLFGIADPSDGVVGRRNDYGNIMGLDKDGRSDLGQTPIYINTILKSNFTNATNRRNFATISPYYWISGGLAQTASAKSADGVEPYALEGAFTTFGPDRKLVPSERGTLTLHYDSGVVDAAGVNIAVFFLNDKGSWVNIGGTVDTAKKTITVPFDEFGYYMVGKLKNSFTDVTSHPWARNVIEGLYSKGYMNNMYFSLFGADDQTTRGEFATLLVKAANLPLNYDNNPSFTDVGPGYVAATWDYAHIETAARAGIVNGLSGNGLSGSFFGANMRLTREQAAVMIARALNLKTALNDTKLDASLSKAFTDSASIEYYAKPAVDAVAKAGIITGKPNAPVAGQKTKTVYFDPQANLTRAEAAQIAVRLLQKSTKVFPSNLN